MTSALKHIPGPKPAFIVGNLPDFIGRDLHVCFYEYSQQYGEIVHFRLANRSNILINRASLIEQVLVTDRDRYYKNAPRKAAETVIGRSVFLSNEPEWAVKRRNHPFSAAGLMDYFDRIWPVIQEQSLTRFQQLQGTDQGNYINLYETLVQVCFPIFGLTVLGNSMSDRLYQEFGCLLQEMSLRALQLFPDLVSLFFRRDRQGWFKFIQEQIREKQLSQNPGDFDILSMVIGSYTELPLSVLQDELSTMFTGGTCGVALTITAVLFLCARHPEVQQKLLNEIDANANSITGLDAINRMVYLDQVVQEALRLYPAVPFFIREVLPGTSTELAGYHIPERTQIFISSWAFHRHSDHWENPDAFIPERFTQAPRPFYYFPFGVGSRECVGKAYTLMFSKVMLLTILSHFTIEFAPNSELVTKYYSGTIMPKKPLLARIQSRT